MSKKKIKVVAVTRAELMDAAPVALSLDAGRFGGLVKIIDNVLEYDLSKPMARAHVTDLIVRAVEHVQKHRKDTAQRCTCSDKLFSVGIHSSSCPIMRVGA